MSYYDGMMGGYGYNLNSGMNNYPNSNMNRPPQQRMMPLEKMTISALNCSLLTQHSKIMLKPVLLLMLCALAQFLHIQVAVLMQ